MRTKLASTLLLTLAALPACDDNIDLDPLDVTAPVEARVRPQPIIGGTMELTVDGRAVVADPDRDMIHVVDLDAAAVQHTIALEPGESPARIALGSEGLAHVVLRGGRGVVTVDINGGTLVRRVELCPDPRGIAFDDSDASLRVACADGRLFHLDEAAGTVINARVYEPDLRDVTIVDGVVWTSTFRSATVISETGDRMVPPPSFDVFGVVGEPRVAWRTWRDHDGRLAMLHQVASNEAITLDPDADDDGGVYGGGPDESCLPGLSDVALSVVDGDTDLFTTRVPEAALSVDVAFAPGTNMFALAMPGAEAGESTVHVTFPFSGCFSEGETDGEDEDHGQVTSVRYDEEGRLIMFSREPARVLIQGDYGRGAVESIDLPGESVFDTGHEIFHRSTESGLSCASCHPEGGDDGHTWLFAELGPRRTQPLDIGLEGTEPFHWDGDMEDMDVLMGEVLAHRMGGSRHSDARRESFKSWLFAQHRPPAGAGLDDPTLVSRGQELFGAYGCARCHDGPGLGGTLTAEVAGEPLQVPVLNRVSLRAPFMHDGRSATLEDAVRDMIATTHDNHAPPAADVDALTAYMRSL